MELIPHEQQVGFQQPVDLAFNFGKHQGQLLSEVPASYLRWLGRKGDPWTFKGVNWTIAAQAELKARASNMRQLLPASAFIPDPIRGLEPDDDVEQAPRELELMSVNAHFMDAFMAHSGLMKLWLERPCRSEPFSVWLYDLMDEVMRPPRVSDVLQIPENEGFTKNVRYLGFRWKIGYSREKQTVKVVFLSVEPI